MMRRDPQLRRSIRRISRGFSLVELMVAFVISLFLVGALVVIYANSQRTYTMEDALVQLQDGERLALSMLNSTVALSGYFVNGTTETTTSVFTSTTVNLSGGSTATFGTGQLVTGTGSGTGTGATSDTVSVRYQTASGDTLLNCNGGMNSTGANTIYVNTFSISANNELQCAVGTAAPVALASNVGKMTVLYGVDTGNNGVIDSYLPATAVTAGGLWLNVYSVVVSLWFLDTTSSTAANPVLLANPVVQTIAFENLQ